MHAHKESLEWVIEVTYCSYMPYSSVITLPLQALLVRLPAHVLLDWWQGWHQL